MTLLRPLASVLTALLLAIAGGSAPALAQAARDGVPPLLDRELFFGNPEIAGAQVSPDGRFISFIKPYQETRNVWVKKVDEPFDAAKLITADTKRPIQGYFWTHDSKYVLYVQDNEGDENFNVFAVDPSAAPAAGQPAPPARNLTAAKGARAFIYDLPLSDPDVMYVGLNDRDAAWHDVYKVRISTGERAIVKQNTEKIAGWMFDNAGALRLALRTADNGDTEILRVDDGGFAQIYSCSVFESCGPVRFHKDNQRVYMLTNKGDADLIGLTLFDVATGAETFVEADPMKRVDLGGVLFSDVTGELILTTYTDDRTRRYFKDAAIEADYRFLEQKLPGREIGLGSSTNDERRWIVSASADVEPGETYLFDRDSKTLTLQYRIREALPRAFLAPMTAIRYKSSDGLEIPAYLTLPKGVAPKNLPVIVVPHGGPWARDGWGYSSLPQFLANRGYAVLQPNFRGSTGYGETFLNAGNNEWGGKMQDDITWGVKHLIAEGTADPERVGILGGSYGGYATLAGLTFTPDVYAAGVSIVGPSNLLTLLETIPPYWEAGRKLFHARMGDPTTPEGKAQLERQSPLNSAAKITTPLMVVQGANDPRVKQAESDQIVIALRDRRFPVAYLVAPDEGHGFARPVNNMAMFAAVERFLAEHLEGRFQDDMPPEIATRLKEITVDPATVTLAEKVDAASVGAPSPARALQAGISHYDAKIAVGGQSMSLQVVSEIKEENGAWVITEKVSMPMGEAADSVTLDKATLQVVKRSVKQGAVAIDLAFDEGKATGTMAMGGQSTPVSVDLGGPLYADGPSANAAIAALPLADGYTATFRNFDLQRQKAALKQLKVSAPEEVTVPAGTFSAYRVDITSAEGEPGTTTLWVRTTSPTVVKITATLPAMGGATMTSELTKGASAAAPSARSTQAPPASTDPRVGLKPGIDDAGVAAKNMELIAHLPKPEGFADPKNLGNLGFANSDFAFKDDILFQGNFYGFNFYSIEDPRVPKLRTSVLCPGGQGDLSVHGNLMFMSVEETRGRLDCGTGGVQGAVSAERFRGVRIFDISDLDKPRQIAAVQTCRGSHTHTLVVDPDDTANIYIYGSGTGGVRSGEELAGCSGGAPDQNPETALFSIDVIQVPLAAPETAKIVSRPRIFGDAATGEIAALWKGGDHGPGTQRTSTTNQCHDITTYPELGLAAGACSGNGILLDIRDPVNPKRLDHVSDKNFAYWHSATFNNDGTKIIFTDEWGGGTQPRCRATDLPSWGANAIFDIVDGKMQFRSYYKLPAPQTDVENCVAHNGSLIPVPGRDIMTQAWYQGGLSIFDFTDSANPVEIAYFDRGPIDAARLTTAGYWSTYWYNGHIYGAEIARGVDIFKLKPSEHLSANEIAAAEAVKWNLFNAQHQPKMTWPPTVLVARAYVDQLIRAKALPQNRITDVTRALDRAEKARSDGDKRSAAQELERLARELAGTSSLELNQVARVAALVETLKGIGASLQ